MLEVRGSEEVERERGELRGEDIVERERRMQKEKR